jgi:inhibitor of KinA sporulation pathway (predicted exonuclease)
MTVSAPKETVRRDRVLVVDIEATCWQGDPPPDQRSEIIEIGVCWLDVETHSVGEAHSILVKPARSYVSPFCTQLTTLTQDMVDGGVSFAAACAALETEFDAKSHLWASWGQYDLKMFKAQCYADEIPYPFSGRHANLKSLYAKAVNNKQRVGMSVALEQMGLPLEGTHHRGGDDARNIARILSALLKRIGAVLLDPYW